MCCWSALGLKLAWQYTWQTVAAQTFFALQPITSSMSHGPANAVDEDAASAATSHRTLASQNRRVSEKTLKSKVMLRTDQEVRDPATCSSLDRAMQSCRLQTKSCGPVFSRSCLLLHLEHKLQCQYANLLFRFQLLHGRISLYSTVNCCAGLVAALDVSRPRSNLTSKIVDEAAYAGCQRD